MKQRIISWLIKKKRLKKYPSLRRFFWKRGTIYRDMERRAAAMRQKDIITVVFMVIDLPCWKSDSVYQMMKNHPRFFPIIWVVPELQVKDEDERLRKREEAIKHFQTLQYTCEENCTLEQLREKYNPDIIFLSKPYDGITPWNKRDFDKELICYIPYTFQVVTSDGMLYGDENIIWRNFYASANICKEAQDCMTNAGANVYQVGAPMADAYLGHSCSVHSKKVWKAMPGHYKRVIWAPHWSIGSVSWFNVATFLEVAEGMRELAEKYKDSIQFAFKPHPLLRDTLYQHPDWGKERTDAYYAFWANSSNSQLETGTYSELFKQSDAMIHDCGSFITEYLFVDKPCMYLMRDDAYTGFNQDALLALDCYYKGKDINDIDIFLQRLLQGAEDIMASPRKKYRKQHLVPPHGKSCAENVIDLILNG